MPWNEETLKNHIKNDQPKPVYVLFGDESYLVEQYTEKLCTRAMDGDSGLADFNLHRFDGLRCRFSEIEEAAEALPLMADRRCVIVRDYDVTAHAESADALLSLVSAPADTTVLIFGYGALPSGTAKNARWKAFLAAVESGGGVVARLDRRTADEVVRMLVAGASRRGCTMRADAARLLVEWCGNDLHLLLCELDKLSALVGPEGEISKKTVEQAATRNLESRVFDLSRAILKGQYTHAYEVLHSLLGHREDPIMINGVLASAFADLYRVKAAGAGGVAPAAVAAVYTGYRGKEFRLTGAARDAAAFSLPTLRQALDILAETDRRLKFTVADNRIVLEETVAQLILLTRR